MVLALVISVAVARGASLSGLHGKVVAQSDRVPASFSSTVLGLIKRARQRRARLGPSVARHISILSAATP